MTLGNKIGRAFYRWIFSWAQADYCLTKDEFEVSWSFLISLLNHKDTKSTLKEEGCKCIQKFIHEHVYPHLDCMCHHTKLLWYFLDEHTNCGQEGTHNGKKNCASPLLPLQNLDRSVEVLTFNERVKYQELMINMCRHSNKKKNW